MARKTTKSGDGTKKAKKSTGKAITVSRARGGGGGSSRSGSDAGEAFIKLLQSPLVADLVAVAATAALAALAEHGFSSSGAAGGRKRASKAVKEAGKAAASAIGRRLTNEFDEIKKASKAKAGAKA